MKFIAMLGLIFHLVLMQLVVFAQPVDDAAITRLITEFKKDVRGPYQAIRWFCPDGRVLPPQERCNQPGAIQHALPKNIVQKIAEERGIWLGQILAGTPAEAFLDAEHLFSRAKQYQIEQYLTRIDDGWILRRARYYRGAIQAEDEAAWSAQFLSKQLADTQMIAEQFFLLRQWAKDLPQESRGNRWDNIRALSLVLGDSIPAFMDLRIKLHGQPESGDVQRVKDFRNQHRDKLKPNLLIFLNDLIADLEIAFRPADLKLLNSYLPRLAPDSPIALQIQKIMQYSNLSDSLRNTLPFINDVSELLLRIRQTLPAIPRTTTRFQMLNLSITMERMLFQSAINFQTKHLAQEIALMHALAKAAAGCGYLEMWEWDAIRNRLAASPEIKFMTLGEFQSLSEDARRVLEWSVGMIRTHYLSDVNTFAGFEPLSHGFIDDRVRGSILLPLGNSVAKLRESAAKAAGVSNAVLGISNAGQMQGLNPGYAMGELVVVQGSPDGIEFSPKKIYVIERPPADLTPVAGIATVSEGNLVSHVQLLARNLGVPNAVLSAQNLQDLLPFSGQTVFYAVSPRGAITIKLAAQMSAEEKALFDVSKRPDERVAVPTDRLDLRNTLVKLRNLRASDSGKLCGPKAANLGELKYLFPDRVVEGFVIPFGAFRAHFDQQMPGKPITYWQFLQLTFERAALDRRSGTSDEIVEKNILERLAELREAVKTIAFLPGFEAQIRQAFQDNFGKPIGETPVFLRSDTNMEDLKEFTGAGLNLTVFNVLDENRIFQAIRDVWASPYTERSYGWRQKYLLNPENVYPSILVIPTVNVRTSGVLITTGISSNDSRDVTIAFSRGAGGAVEGQAAESYLLRHTGENQLLSPARELRYTLLPESGGTKKGITSLNLSLLQAADLQQLRGVATEIRKRARDSAGQPYSGALDVELGFYNGKIWLFQVRPFVENKRARSSDYLQKMDPQLDLQKTISLEN